MTESEESGMTVLIQFHLGDDPPRELAVFVDSLEEARDFAHMSLRWAVKETGRDNGAAELLYALTNERIGRIAVLFDESSHPGIDHEQWTWVRYAGKKSLH